MPMVGLVNMTSIYALLDAAVGLESAWGILGQPFCFPFFLLLVDCFFFEGIILSETN
jgi:hypothetical protein